MKIDRLLKTVISALLCSVLSFSALGADDPVAKFEKLILKAESAINKRSATVNFNDNVQAWAKNRSSVIDIKYDVKKTESLVSPIVGLVTFQLVSEQTDLYPTKEEAEASFSFIQKFHTPRRVSLTYSYKDNVWSFSKGSYERLDGILRGNILNFTEEEIRDNPTSAPFFFAIQYWLPK